MPSPAKLKPAKPGFLKNIGYFLSNIALHAVLALPGILPYGPRVRTVGLITAHIIAPLAGYRKRIRENLAYTCPDLDAARVKALCRAVPDNAGRTLTEVYSGDQFVSRVRRTQVEGPGLAALDAAHAEGRPIIVVSGHFGNYDAPRAALRLRGHKIGALYRPFRNPYFDRHYRRAITRIAAPVFPQGRAGLAGMIKFLKAGNTIALLMDQYASYGPDLEFFGKPAPSSLSAAEMALKYNALLVPVYGVRQENGLDFKVIIETPIAHSDPVSMSQDIVNSLEARVRDNMDQWLWVHRRWKPERRQRNRAAPTIGP